MAQRIKRLRIRPVTVSDEGFVIMTALMVVFLIVSIVACALLITASDLRSNLKSRHAIEARFAGESLSDAVYARMAGLDDLNCSNIVNNLQVSWAADGHNLFDNSGGTPIDFSDKWFKFDDAGKLTMCVEPGDYVNTCFKAKLESVVDAVTHRKELVLSIIVRSRCNSSGKNCTYRSFQQRYRIRTYADGVLLTSVEDSNYDGASYPVAYLPGDTISGGVHTNDNNGFAFCGTGNPINATQFSSDGGAKPTGFTAGETFCGSSTTPVTPLPDEFLIGQVDTRGKNVDSGLNDNSVFKTLAGLPGTTHHRLTGETIHITPTHVYYGAEEKPYPTNGVIYVNGDVNLEASQYARGLTIYATGNIAITGNITRPATYSDSTLLGLATPQDIILQPDSGGCQDRRVDAVLDAIGTPGRIYNPRWKDVAMPADPNCKFTLNGAIISRSHPVFGSYTSVSPGAALRYGWAKDLHFDTRLEDHQPPYFFRTTQANVVRSALDEGSCTPAQRATICT